MATDSTVGSSMPLALTGDAGPVPPPPKPPPPWAKLDKNGVPVPFRAPTGEELKNLGYVKGLFAAALKATNAGDRKEAHEKGGWIYLNLTDAKLVHRWSEDDPKGVKVVTGSSGTRLEFSINLNKPPTISGWVIVAQFHAHPLTLKELKPSGPWPRGPSPDDESLAVKYQVPVFVVDAADVYLIGRVSGRRDLGGNPGYPRDRP